MGELDVTVIVWCLTYNQKEYIKNALDGFIMQETTFPFEVIVHDDASTDGTTDIIKEYAKNYPDIIKPMIEKDNQWQRGGLKHIIACSSRFRGSLTPSAFIRSRASCRCSLILLRASSGVSTPHI